MGKYVTIVSIAQHLGISHSTVSRALNDNPRISEKTRLKVKQLAEELGYHANSNAYLLSKGKSRLIGVIVPDLSVPFFSRVLDSMQKELKDTDYSVLLFNTSESAMEEKQAVEKCLDHRVDGVVAAISVQTKDFNHFEKLLDHQVPLVFYDRVANFLPVPKIVTDDYQASYNATSHLIASGCRCIAHITASINLNNSNNRLYGYLDALKDHNIETDESLIHYYEFDQKSIETFLRKAFINSPELDGLFVFNDYVANYSINFLNKIGKNIPEDISVIGFSDEPVATFMVPQLSTVEQTATKMGMLATQKMLSILDGKEQMNNEKITINPKLILRETTKV